ncbi:hypothetical protein J4E93_009441 [Alternaria ventricosa]|uniref:uncharacterized protein n=1 Tax=Alternaria ventricosa TaxID=1187951 RepID=UPI0020C49DA3|nr:uncharacterized protein J4E93_009441 [Alternaria ventricosa]KAI4639262.1 hypothetical protein J4E93_009441 [Alternaria ventricosa]
MIDDHAATWQSLIAPAQNNRPASQGTMIVDWDGNMKPIVHYRRKSQEEQALAALDRSSALPLPLSFRRGVPNMDPIMTTHEQKPLPSLPIDRQTPVRSHIRSAEQSPRTSSASVSSHNSSRHDSVISDDQPSPRRRLDLHVRTSNELPTAQAPLSSKTPIYEQQTCIRMINGIATYYPPRISQSTGASRPGYVEGYDEDIMAKWNFDGQQFNVHRSADQLFSPISDHFDIDEDEYSQEGEPHVEEQGITALPVKQVKRRSSVTKLVEKVIFKLEGLGLTKKLKKERKSDKKKQSWRKHGYHD